MSYITCKRWLVILSCLVLAFSLVAVIASTGKAEAQGAKLFTILHTNDEHSDLIPYGPACDYPAYPTKGGFARIAHLLNQIRDQKASEGEPVLTLNAGDFTQGTLYSWLDSTEAPELVLLKEMGYDVATLGNHEFDLKPDYLATMLGAAKANGVNLPILCANINIPPAETLFGWLSETDLGGSDLKIQRYTVKTLSNGLKVGMFGIMGVDAEAVTNAEPVTFGNTDPFDEAASFENRVTKSQEMVDLLRAAPHNCDVVVALSHSGVSEEISLAQSVSGIDVLVGGHSHDLVYPPMIIGDTIYAQANAYTTHLGVLELQYENGEVSLRDGDAIVIDQNIPNDATIETAIDQYTTLLNAEFQPLLGKEILDPMAETDLGGDGGFNLYAYPAFQETNLGDLIADSYLNVVNSLVPAEPARMAFEANGNIRSSVFKGGLGHFCFYDLYSTVPLGGSATDPTKPGYPLVAFYLQGNELWAAMNVLLGLGNNDYFLQLSGARILYNPAVTGGNKVKIFQVQGAGEAWEDVKKDATLYKIVINYYTASFMSMFGLKPRDATGAQKNVDDFLIIKPDTSELRCWEALQEYVAAMPDLDGDGLPNIAQTYRTDQDRLQPESWYLAEGSTAGGMETFILVQNPGDTEAQVNMYLQTAEGEQAPEELQEVTIPPTSRSTFKLNDYVESYNVSTKVECLQGEVICERAMYGNGRAWAHDSIGTAEPTVKWYLAEGSTAGGMETWVLVQNPSAGDVKVNISFHTDAGEQTPAALQGVTIPAESRSTFYINDYVPENYNVSTLVEASNGGVVCERAMYGNSRTWAHDSIGVTAAAPTWYLAEGSTAGGMETFVLVQNPGAADVNVNLKFQTDSGEWTPEILQGVTIPAHGRQTYKVNDYVESYNVSTKVECLDGMVVCERSMYGNGRAWAHDSIGVTEASSTWYLAEGSTAGGMETFVLVQNPGAADANINLKFQTDSGEWGPEVLQGVTIPAHSRQTFKVNDYVESYNVSTKVECLDGMVVCERSMYGNGRVWAHDSIGYAPLAW